MNGWDNVPDDVNKYVGFVYKVTELDTGMMYYGIKKFWKRVKYPPLKGYKRKRIKYLESDWRGYNTSSPLMQKKIKANQNNYKKEILRLCCSVSEMKVYEAYYQLKTYVDGEWHKIYNEVINLRLRLQK